MEEKNCKDCAHFLGGGDWNLCCDNPPKSQVGWLGHLCYEDTEACENFKEKEEVKVKLPEVCNGTDYELEELDEIAWEKIGEESALGVSAITYIDPDDTVVKKVWHDGMTEYYYT